MNKKIIGILICTLFIGASVLPKISGDQTLNKASENFNGIDWWPMFRHDTRHRGYSTSKAPDTNYVRWRYACIGFNGVASSPAVADGKVYIGSVDSNVYCLDVITGRMIWNYTVGVPVVSSPAVADGKVYIGSDDRNVYCLDALTGNKIWSYTTGDNVAYSCPAVADGKVYIGSYDDNVYCLDALTGNKIWSYTTGGGMFSSPAVADGKVYIGSEDSNVYCLDALTGNKIWSYTTGDEVGSSPAVADGKVYIGSFDMNVYCLNASTGNKIWSYTTGNCVFSSPAVADGKVYIGSFDNYVYCFGNQPPEQPTITGQKSGKAGVEYEYKFISTDPEGDNIEYCIYWGDNAGVFWIGPYPSGIEASANYTWSEKGDYTIKAKAKDVYGAESDWATLTVSMPKSKAINAPLFFQELFQRFPFFEKILNQYL
ncbi:MAG: PQQ-binding-like beta-propeller repeat protein [Candidatus Thermoplasmatota archaeon]|nr:PQQ-binding-like beta-propeller repeat protein [Candidatus Thermoplasmatota archaeon]